MQGNLTLPRVTMNEHGFWDDCAEAHRLAIEGNRLIAQEIAEGIRGLWRRVMRWLDVGPRRHLPPI
jgi:hypothetical protein